jgi:hypothetical protein
MGNYLSLLVLRDYFKSCTNLDVQAGESLLHGVGVVCRVCGGVAMTMLERAEVARELSAGVIEIVPESLVTTTTRCITFLV